MCVLKCSVWSLKKASLGCDKLCWWPLNFSTLHNYTCIKIDKFIDPKVHEILQNFWSTPASRTWAGLRPIRTIGFDKPPAGRAKLDCLKQRASCKTLSLETWRDSWHEHLLALDSRGSLEHGVTLLNIPRTWLDALEHLLNSARNFSACSRSYLKLWPRHRLNQPSSRIRRIRRHNSKEQRTQRLQTIGEPFSVTSRGSIHISRVSTREHPKKHEQTHVVSEDKDQSNAFEGNETTSNLLIVNKQVPLTKSILLIELVKSDLRAVTE